MIALMAVALHDRHHHFKAWLSMDKASVSMHKHDSARFTMKEQHQQI